MLRTKIGTTLLVFGAALAVFFLVTTAFAAERLEESDVAAQSAGAKSAMTRSGSGTWRRTVRCDRGEKLGRILRRAKPGARVRVKGTCTESVAITTDDLTLVGIGAATIDGRKSPSEAVLQIDGVRGFTIENLVVQNGSDQGILVQRQAQGVLRSVTATHNGTVGLAIDRSHVEIEDVTLDMNGSSGMDAFSSSTVVAFGDIRANSNTGSGLVANGKTFFEIRGARVVAEHNQGTGVSIINDSRLQIFSFPEAQGSSIHATNNGFAGVGLAGAEMSVVGEQFFGSGANVITASDNALFGFFMPAGGIFSPHATAKFVASGNRVGMLMEDGANAIVIGGLDIQGNGAGISAVGAGTLTLVSVEPNPSTVNVNLLDFDFGFGTRATVDGVTSTSIVCDGTNLLRGTLACP